MPHAFILGGGQIATAAATALTKCGWSVTVASRTSSSSGNWTAVSLDRGDTTALRRALGDGADLLLDTIGFDEADAIQLLQLQSSLSQIVTISSASVYCDEDGRTLDEARQSGFPVLPEYMTEQQPTVLPGPATYSTRKIAMERRLLDCAKIPAAVLRPCAVHGPNSRHPREWWFVKRLLDGRERIPLAFAGESRFHTSATINIAALVVAVSDAQASGVFNAVDPDAPNVVEIGTAILTALERTAELVRITEDSYPPQVGATPWSVPLPFTLADGKARTIGYTPVADYSMSIRSTCHWLATCPRDDWHPQFPQLAAYPWPLFDYAAEDAWLTRQQ